MNSILRILAETPIKLDPNQIGYKPGITTLSNSSIGSIMNTVYLIAGMIAVLIIVVAGFFYITSNGDSNQLAKAKNTILYAVIGLVVVMFAFAITQFVISRVHG